MSVLILTVDEVMRTLTSDGQYPFVENDKTVDIVRFALNTGFTDVVLDENTALRVMYQRPGETEVRAQTLTYYDTDGLRNYYDWQLSQSDLAKNGLLMVALCILRTDSEVEEWHTTPCQVRVLGTIHTDDSDEADETITPTVAERVAVLETMIQRVASGSPIVVANASAMTDADQIYVLSTDGKWYYHNGSAWVAGGEYGAVATDTTLTQSGIPADAKAVGDGLAVVEDSLNAQIEMLGKSSKIGAYDFTNVDTSGYTINGVGKWASSSIAKSHIIKIPKGAYSISVTANSEQTAIIAFLNSFTPAVGAQADFSDGYSERIVIEAGASAEYEIDDGMVYVYVLIADTSSNDHTPSLSLTYPVNLPLPIDRNDNDRSGEISALLNAFGVCELEKGVYAIGSSIKMSENSRLAGTGSEIILGDAVTDGSAVIMSSNCIITGVTINGGLTSAPSSEGTRNGIEWTGDTLLTSFVDKCVITGFSGSGIFLHDTTAKTFRNLLIVNCRITACFVGIDFRRNTEFNRVSNCTIIANRYGIRNRGGNNHIGNCGLDANYCGILVDMDEGDNTGHGGIANCTINHSNHNNGYGLIIKDTGRMLITACNFYYSKIKLENTNGNIINGCGFGNSTGWEISGGECSMFVNCMVASTAQTPITITNNTAAKVVNCFTRDGVEVVIAGGAA